MRAALLKTLLLSILVLSSVLLWPQPSRAQLVFSEVLFNPVGVDTAAQVIELENVGMDTVDMGASGYWLYWAPARWQFPPGVSVPPGGRVLVHVNRGGVDTEDEFFTGLSGTRSLRGVDSVSLFLTESFADPGELLDFLQWGRAGQDGESVADQAGVWTLGDPIETTSLREGASIAYDGDGDASSDWCVDGTPTIGIANDECTRPFAQRPVRINEIGFVRVPGGTDHYAVELRNDGVVVVDLSGCLLALDNITPFPIPSGTVLTPGELLVIHIGVDGDDGLFDVFTGASVIWQPAAGGTVSLHVSSDVTNEAAIVDFVAWGMISRREEAAVLAGLWSAGEFVAISTWRDDGSLAVPVEGGLLSNGVGRWAIDNTGTVGRPNDAPPETSVVINEILIDPLGDDEGSHAIELISVVDKAVDLQNYTICLEGFSIGTGTTCYTLPGIDVSTNAFIVIHWNQFGTDSATDLFSGVQPAIDPGGGSLSLFVHVDDTNTNNLIDFVQWGPFDSPRESDAVGVSIWSASEQIDVSGAQDGTSIAYRGSGDSVLSYRLDSSPSIGMDNEEVIPETPFRRGDCNDDGGVNIADALSAINVLFSTGAFRPCGDACDANDDGREDISDPISILNHLFGGADIPDPFAICGFEAEADQVPCDDYTSC